jgi:putative transport protein
MIEWFIAQMRDRPVLTFFATITLGYAIGRIRIGWFTLGAVTAVLLAGVLIGQLGVSLPSAIKQIFFLLFLFSVGYRTGPHFFRGFEKDGLAQAALAAIFGCMALFLTDSAARILGYDAGTAAGLLTGAFTESATIGTDSLSASVRKTADNSTKRSPIMIRVRKSCPVQALHPDQCAQHP